MNIAIVTGSAGLVGSQAVRFLSGKGYRVVGIDNDLRKTFFGQEASTAWNLAELERDCPDYRHADLDIRDALAMHRLFDEYATDIKVVIHAAAQPSHDWAARDPLTDFTINANGTLIMLENTRKYAPRASFIFTSTNKVYGDRPNQIELRELETRWECPSHSPHHNGINEAMSIDACTHSIFGASKVAADVLTQEYGRYYKMNTAVFRCGCLTGPSHSGAQLHGFLAYLAKCAVTGAPYTVFGYKAKQVRDNIHVKDLLQAFWHYLENPRPGEVYNMGGGRHSNCSMLEAIGLCEKFTGKPLRWSYSEQNRIGDHIWYVSDLSKFESHYPAWSQSYGIESTLREMLGSLTRRLEGA